MTKRTFATIALAAALATVPARADVKMHGFMGGHTIAGTALLVGYGSLNGAHLYFLAQNQATRGDLSTGTVDGAWYQIMIEGPDPIAVRGALSADAITILGPDGRLATNLPGLGALSLWLHVQPGAPWSQVPGVGACYRVDDGRPGGRSEQLDFRMEGTRSSSVQGALGNYSVVGLDRFGETLPYAWIASRAGGWIRTDMPPTPVCVA